MEWIGLRPSQVEHLSKPKATDNNNGETTSLQALPDAVFQELTELDRKRLTEHLLDETHKFTSNCGGANNRQRRLNELHNMQNCKVELEALHWLGVDFCGTFFGELLQGHETKLQQQVHEEDDDEENDDDDMGWMDII